MNKVILAGMITLMASTAMAGSTRNYCRDMSLGTEDGKTGIGYGIYIATGTVNFWIPATLATIYGVVCIPKREQYGITKNR